MGRFGLFTLIIAGCCCAEASWYWPFGSDAVDEKPKRVSELIEPASLLIEEAADLAAEEKTDEAIEKYRKALAELDRIEIENPERVKSAEFATVRNKRAYVNAAIDSMLLEQVKSNAKVVAVSDTTELERRLDRERWGKRIDKAKEAFDRRDTREALEEIEKAWTGTTNAVMIAIARAVGAAFYCQKGAFGEACRSLAQSRQKLDHAGSVGEEDRRLAIEILRNVRLYVVEPYRLSLEAGRRVRAGVTRLESADLTSTNAVASANGVLAALGALQNHLNVFAFAEARNLSRASSNVQMRVSVMLRRMASGKKRPSWDVDMSGFDLSMEDFAALAPEVKRVDAGVSIVLKVLGEEKKEGARQKASGDEAGKVGEKEQVTPEPSEPSQPSAAPRPQTKREKVIEAISTGDYTTAKRLLDEMLVEKPNGAAALNLKAVMEARQGKFTEAEATLDQAIMSNPRSHFAYYNMANLMLQVRSDDKSVAKRYYETGRALGGPVDARLEEVFK